MPGTLIDCRDLAQRREATRRGAALLAGGGLVVFPTETVYGVGAAVASEKGIERLDRLKERPDNKPFSVHLPDPEAISRYIDMDGRPSVQRLVRKTMPGPITLVVEVDDKVIEAKLAGMGLTLGHRDRLYHDNTIGLRCPDDPVAAQLLGGVDGPVVASSANLAGQAPPLDSQTAAAAIGEQVDLILDGGRCRFGKPSTVVRIVGDSIQVLREGVFDARYLNKLLHRTLLFICTGNTCRSPMAEAIATHELARRQGAGAGQAAPWTAASAGVYAASGAPATPEGIGAVRSLGIEAAEHRARPLTAEMLREADAVFGMTDSHVEAARLLAPDARGKIHRLDADGDIEDPIGAGESVYLECARRLQRLIRGRLDEMGLAKPRQ